MRINFKIVQNYPGRSFAVYSVCLKFWTHVTSLKFGKSFYSLFTKHGVIEVYSLTKIALRDFSCSTCTVVTTWSQLVELDHMCLISFATEK